MCSVGFPLMSLMRVARPSRRPRTASWEIGFCSKNSLTNSCAYLRVRRYRVGRRSFSIMDCDKSRIRTRWRIMPRCNGVVSLKSLQTKGEKKTRKSLASLIRWTDRFCASPGSYQGKFVSSIKLTSSFSRLLEAHRQLS